MYVGGWVGGWVDVIYIRKSKLCFIYILYFRTVSDTYLLVCLKYTHIYYIYVYIS